MAERPMITIELTRDQQLEVLAATGLLVRALEVDPASLDEAGAAAASLPLPDWLKKRTAAG
jgi:hypothetical protein